MLELSSRFHKAEFIDIMRQSDFAENGISLKEPKSKAEGENMPPCWTSAEKNL